MQGTGAKKTHHHLAEQPSAPASGDQHLPGRGIAQKLGGEVELEPSSRWAVGGGAGWLKAAGRLRGELPAAAFGDGRARMQASEQSKSRASIFRIGRSPPESPPQTIIQFRVSNQSMPPPAAAAAAAAAATPTAGGDWTVVRRGGRRRGDTPPTAAQHDAPPLLPVTPIPWSPSDPSLDPARVSHLVARAHAAISRVSASRLYRRLLLPDSPLRRRLRLLAPARLSLVGVGSFESSPAARLQLALAALLRRYLLPDAASADLFDPVLSAAECAAAAALGFSVPSLDDGCRRRVEEPTLFYMPHCEASLYNALLAANWDSPAQLRRVCVLGNSFRRYALQAEDNRSGPAAKAAHVLAAGQFVCEERVGETGDLDEDDWFARAFNETSWHFFEVDDDVDLAASTAGGGR